MFLAAIDTLHTFALELTQKYDATKKLFNTQHLYGVAHVCHRRRGVWSHR